ncbi:hypothetical protein AB0M43_36930 [Longispora sp. NPDC051575]|uniref:hypothetical protein n=1 Tax=Longispora sp. NPDC051575 TaxID=3154943 RepID=UPI0034432431
MRSQREAQSKSGMSGTVAVFNSVVVGLGGLYASTRSLTVVAVVGVIAVAMVYLARRIHRRGRNEL